MWLLAVNLGSLEEWPEFLTSEPLFSFSKYMFLCHFFYIVDAQVLRHLLWVLGIELSFQAWVRHLLSPWPSHQPCVSFETRSYYIALPGLQPTQL